MTDEVVTVTPLSLLDGLSKREKEIFFLLVTDAPNRAIAKKLFISPRTIETHRSRILEKLGCKSRYALIIWAIKNQLIEI